MPQYPNYIQVHTLFFYPFRDGLAGGLWILVSLNNSSVFELAIVQDIYART